MIILYEQFKIVKAMRVFHFREYRILINNELAYYRVVLRSIKIKLLMFSLVIKKTSRIQNELTRASLYLINKYNCY